MIKEQKLQNLVNNAKYIFSLIAQYEIGEDDNGKFLARKLKRKVDKIYL